MRLKLDLEWVMQLCWSDIYIKKGDEKLGRYIASNICNLPPCVSYFAAAFDSVDVPEKTTRFLKTWVQICVYGESFEKRTGVRQGCVAYNIYNYAID